MNFDLENFSFTQTNFELEQVSEIKKKKEKKEKKSINLRKFSQQNIQMLKTF